uniref:Uncharacterized protein LOC111101912 n=1 Tax=Crassostrea virginica TaxID=6565 RepID=A0A8B8AGH8_CRAVI|nr:uncharacterized protein LOC111101912 [Crassostrea virginica]
MNRPSNSKFKEKEQYFCKPCNYWTDRFGNYARHVLTRRHEQLYNLNHESDSNEPSPVSVESLSSSEDSDFSSVFRDGPCTADSVTDHVFDSSTSEDSEFDLLDADACNIGHVFNDSEWYPYDSKLHFLLSILHSSKTHKVSDEVLSFFLYILKDLGLKNVPTLGKIKSFWFQNLKLEDMIQQNEDELGNVHWMVKPSEALKLILSNPHTAKLIDRYPRSQSTSTPTPQSAGDKWKEMKFHWSAGFVLGEVVSYHRNGNDFFGLIKNFFLNEEDGKVYGEIEMLREGNHAYFDNLFNEDDQESLIIMNKTHKVPVDNLSKTEIKIEEFVNVYKRETEDGMEHFNLLSEEEKNKFFKTTPLWKGKPIIKVPLNLFIDDMSANRSKRWAPMHAVQAQASGLSLAEKARNQNTIFLSSSETVSMMDLIKPICDDLQVCKETGIDAFDALLEREVTLTSEIDAIIADYQMMSLVSNHLGPSALKFCPKCQADKSDPYSVWELRTADRTRRTLNRLKINPSATVQKQTGIKFYDNCLWDHIDPHRDSPTGILHFMYLGLAKHPLQKRTPLKFH